MEGRLLLAGVRWRDLSVPEFLSVVHAALLDTLTGAGVVSFDEVAAKIEQALGERLVPSWESWGTGPSAEAGLRAMMELAGGPAPLRNDA